MGYGMSRDDRCRASDASRKGGGFLRPAHSLLCAVAMLAVFVLLAILPASGSTRVEPRKPGSRIALGDFEIVIGERGISAGGFPNTTMNPFRRTRVSEFTVRHGGRAVAIDAGGGNRPSRFDMIHVLRDAPIPAILVPHADFHLLTSSGGRLDERPLGAATTQSPSLQWLDAVEGQPGPQIFARTLGLHAPSSIELAGGRWLLLNRFVVLDVRTLRSHRVQPWIASGSDRPMQGLNASVSPAVAFSPRGTQYVLLASGRDDVPADGFDRALLVVDIPSGESYGVDIPARLRPELDAGRVTADWIGRHYRWRDVGGRERLEIRE